MPRPSGTLELTSKYLLRKDAIISCQKGTNTVVNPAKMNAEAMRLRWGGMNALIL